jgi:hypothetical protein
MRRSGLASPAVVPGSAPPLSPSEIHKHVWSIKASDWQRMIMIFAFSAVKARYLAGKLVSSISFNCQVTVGRRLSDLHPQAADIIVADSDQERFISPPLCRFHLYVPPGPRSWAKWARETQRG